MARREDKDCEPTHSAGGHRKLRVPNPAQPPPQGKEVSPGKQREQTSGPPGLERPLPPSPRAAARSPETRGAPEPTGAVRFQGLPPRPACVGDKRKQEAGGPRLRCHRETDTRGEGRAGPKAHQEQPPCAGRPRGGRASSQRKGPRSGPETLRVPVQLHHLPTPEPGADRRVFTFCLSNGDKRLCLHQLR